MLLRLGFAVLASFSQAQTPVDTVEQIRREGLRHPQAYSLLSELSGGIGSRLSGSEGAAKAVDWGVATMKRLGFSNVHLVPCKVPHWVRGAKESAEMEVDGRWQKLACCALGGSIATKGDLIAEVVEAHSIDEALALKSKAAGKIVFYNGSMDPTFPSTFEAYGRAGAQRFVGAAAAGKVGAVATVVRSMTTELDDTPHTGVQTYEDGVPKIPTAAISTMASEALHKQLEKGPVKLKLRLNCQTLPDVDSASVAGELVGSEHPDEIILMGGHLDSWDLGRGAHDDGAGVVQSLEALSIMRRLGLQPKRTIRVVLFMNEENGGRGAEAYLEAAKKETGKHIVAIESDSGGFMPRTFGISAKGGQLEQVQPWLSALHPSGIERFEDGGGDADIEPLGVLGTILVSLQPESARYFDYHHTVKDTIDKVNSRELECGATAMAGIAYFYSEFGVAAK